MMSANLICPGCGGTSNHFSRNRNVMVCDSCGRILQTEAERNADISFERTMGLARQHLQVGNWEEAKRLIKPFCSTRPSDKQLNLMLLMAVTKGYSDYLLNDEAGRKEAYEYWDKLKRLRCVNETMREYADRREQYIYQEHTISSSKKVAYIGISVLLTFIAICLIGAREAGAALFVIASIVSWIITIDNMKKLSRDTSAGRIGKYGDDNPFH